MSDKLMGDAIANAIRPLAYLVVAVEVLVVAGIAGAGVVWSGEEAQEEGDAW